MKTVSTRKRITNKVALLLLCIFGSPQLLAESRINANNAAYFQDTSLAQSNAHAVESLAYGEALFLMHSNQDLSALVRLQQETAKNNTLGLYPSLLKASLAAQQSLTALSQNALEQAQTSPVDEGQYDLDRLYSFQAELAYESKQQKLFEQSLAKIARTENLPDPDSVHYLKIQAALEQDSDEQATRTLNRMALSPWKAISQVNIALWHYRQQHFEAGLELLQTALNDIDNSIDDDAYEYWYKKGRRSADILSSEQHLFQQEEMRTLSDKILTLMGFGHLKILDKGELVQGSSAFEDRLTLAQNAIFQIPQNSIYATQGLELLTQSLINIYNNAPQDTLFRNEKAQATKQATKRQHLERLLTTLTTEDRPMLTRLRSHFALVQLAETDGQTQGTRQARRLMTILEQEIAQRRTTLAKPNTYFANILSPFYVPQSEQHALADLFSLKGIDIKEFPIHQSRLIDWLSQPSTAQYIKTLQFFQEGLQFSQEWFVKKEVLELQSKTNASASNITSKKARLLERQQTLQGQLNEIKKISSNNDMSIATTQERRVLSRIERLLQKSRSSEAQNVAASELAWLSITKGEIIWQQEQRRPLRQQRLKATIQTLEQSLAQNQNRLNTMDTTNETPSLSYAAIQTLDQRIRSLNFKVQRALELNKKQFILSFKQTIQQEQQHLQAALVSLKLKQAALVQNSGADNE